MSLGLNRKGNRRVTGQRWRGDRAAMGKETKSESSRPVGTWQRTIQTELMPSLGKGKGRWSPSVNFCNLSERFGLIQGMKL